MRGQTEPSVPRGRVVKVSLPIAAFREQQSCVANRAVYPAWPSGEGGGIASRDARAAPRRQPPAGAGYGSSFRIHGFGLIIGFKILGSLQDSRLLVHHRFWFILRRSNRPPERGEAEGGGITARASPYHQPPADAFRVYGLGFTVYGLEFMV